MLTPCEHNPVINVILFNYSDYTFNVSHCLATRIEIKPRNRVIAEHASSVSTSYSIPGTEHKLRYVTAEIVRSVLQMISQKDDLGLNTTCDKSRHSNKVTSESSVAHVTETTFTQLLELSDSQHTDLIPGLYEGGMKTWECAYDLVDYLSEIDFDFTGMNVLELGCGTGLPSIYALMKGARSISLQDYNPEVIDCITIPSVLLNLHSTREQGISSQTHSMVDYTMKNMTPFSKNRISESAPKCLFYSCDWKDFDHLLTNNSCLQDAPCKFDVILTSETIYSEPTQPILLSAMKSLLEPTKGCIFVAAKTYYFGVGGSCHNFEHLVESDGYFELKRCKTIDCSVPRIIMCLKHPNTL